MTTPTIVANAKTFPSVAQLDFIDIGGSQGGSYEYIKNKFKLANGLTIDIDPNKVNIARTRGIPAIQLDATNMHIFNDNACKMVSIIHTLEHLPDANTIEGVLKESIRVASDKVYIRGPMFYISDLSSQNLQFYWSHWRGHTCLIEANDIIQMMERMNISHYTLNYLNQVHNSSDPSIHPKNGLIDRHAYDPRIDPPKPSNIVFSKKIYKEFELIFDVHQSNFIPNLNSPSCESTTTHMDCIERTPRSVNPT